MRKKVLSWLLAVSMVLSIFGSVPMTAAAVTLPGAVFSDGDLDRVYFSGDILTFNLSGLPVGTPPTGIPAGTALRVSLGIVDASGTFSDFTLFNTSELTPEDANYVFNGMGDLTGWYLSRTLNADGTLSSAVSGTIVTTPTPTLGVAAVKIYVNTGAAWQNIMQGQPVEYIPLTADTKDAIVGLDGIMEMPDGVTCTPTIGSGAQNTEDLRSFDAKFTKIISASPAISGSIEFTGLNLMDSTLQSQLDDLNDGLIMQKISSPTGGATSQFTMGILDSAAAALASLGATVSVTSAALFDGLSTSDFSAVPADVVGGSVSSLTFNDTDDTVSFAVDHFSSYTLSVTDPNAGTPLTETEYQNAAAGLVGAKIYDSATLPNGDIGALFNMSGSILYGVLNISENKWTTVTLGAAASTDVNAATLALDGSGYPHIVFVNSDDDLVYRYQKADGWTAGTTIDSLNIGAAGALYSPDISIDGSGNAHIAYMDTKGGYRPGEDYYNYADLMYATNTSGSFAITVKQYGDGSYWGTSDSVSWDKPIAPSKIVLASSDIYVGSKFHDKYSNIYSNSYYYKIYRSLDTLSYTIIEGSTSDTSLGFTLFEMDTDGTNAYSLFTQSSNLYVANGVTSLPAATKAFGASTADLYVDNADSGKLYYAAISGSTLLLYQNGSFKESLSLPASLSGTHVKLSTVVSGTTQYVLYTDAVGKLQVTGYQTMVDAVAPVNNETYPNITGANASGFTVNAGTDESSIAYYVVVDKDAAAPNSAQVIAGVNYDAVTVRAAGNIALLPNSPSGKAVTGLTAATEYDIYVVAKDLENNIQAAPAKLQTITGIPAGAATIQTVYDCNVNQDETDIRIVFSPAADESKVSEYRVFIIPEAGASTFDCDAASSITDNTKYVTVSKTSISGGVYTLNLPNGVVIPNGDAVAVNTSYKLFVLSVATGSATINSLTGPSAAVVVTNFTGTLGGSDATPEVGQTVTITVTDNDENSDITAADTVTVPVVSSLDATGISVTLSETGANTGIFSGTIVIDGAASNDTIDHIYAYGGQTVTVRYTDAITATGATNALTTATLTIDPTQLAAPTLSVSGTTVSWADQDNESGYVIQLFHDTNTQIGSEMTLTANTTSFDLNTIGLGYDNDYYVKVMADGDSIRYTDSPWSAASDLITIKNKVTIGVEAGNPTQIINNGNTTAFYFTISGTGISSSGDTNPTLKSKLAIAISGTSNCTFAGGINDVIFSRVDDNTVRGQVYISSTAAGTETASFTATVSVVGSGSLNATHEAGSPASVTVSSIDVNDPPPTTAPDTGDISSTRTSATEITLNIADATDGVIYRAYTAATGGSLLGSGTTFMGLGVSMSGLAVNSSVSTVYITRQLNFNYAESTPRTAVSIDTYTTSINPSGDYTFPNLPDGYANGSQHTQTFTISNTGTAALTGVSVALSGADAANFTLTQPATTIAAAGSTTFTLKAKDGLAVDSYTATITVSTANIADKSFGVTQIVAVLPSLSAPSPTISGTTASWGAIENAASYMVRVQQGGVDVCAPISTTSLSLNLALLPGESWQTLASGTYDVSVKAVANPATHLDSVYSAPAVATVTTKNALEQVNAAADAAAMKTALESNKTALGISDNVTGTAAANEYADLTVDGKTVAVTYMLTGSPYTNNAAVASAFAIAVKKGVLSDEIAKYETTATLAYDASRDDDADVESLIKLLKSGKMANSDVLISSRSLEAVTPNSADAGGAMLASGSVITAPKPNWIGTDGTATVRFTFSFGGETATFDVTVTIAPVPASTVIKIINEAGSVGSTQAILDVIENRTKLGIGSAYLNYWDDGDTATTTDFTLAEKLAVATAAFNSGSDYIMNSTGANAIITAYEEACMQVFIDRAEAIIGTSFTAVEGIDSNLLTSLTNKPGMNVTGVTIALTGKTPADTMPVTIPSGVVTYNASSHIGTVSMTLAFDTKSIPYTIDVNIPQADTVAPTAGGSGTITTASVAQTSLTLNWTAANDDVTDTSNLKYFVVQSSANNIDTINNCEANGTPVTESWITATTLQVTGLNPGTKYYFNVAVKDLSGNYTVYTMVEVPTAAYSGGGAPAPTQMIDVETSDGSIGVTGTLITSDNKEEITVGGSKFSQLAGTDQSIVIPASAAIISFDSKAVDTINGASSTGDVVLTVERVDASTMSAEQQQLVGDRPVYDFTVTKDGIRVSDFGGGHAEISIPYTLKSGEDPNKVVIYFLADDGSLKPVRGRYDSTTKTVVFQTTHFSKYAIGYNPVSFIDVDSDSWYKDAVDFIAARGITSGTGNGAYSPDAPLTRGQFVVLLMNAYGISTESVPAGTANFADAGSTYYTNYLLAAKSLGIVNGVGNNMFAPEQAITRQEMFVMLYNALNVIGELPAASGTKQLSDFGDSNQVASWALETMRVLVIGDVISGSNGMLNPTSSTTRAEMAQMLYNLLSK